MHRKIFLGIFWCLLLLSGSALATTQITTCAELQWMSLNLNGQYELANDIDCTGFSFTPIGTSEANPFTGSLDGQDYTIKNLEVNQPNISYVGLFGVTKDATIRRLNLEDVRIVGKNYAGALVGFGQSTLMSDVSSSGKVSVIQNLQDISQLPRGVMGGVVGSIINSTITRGISSVEVALQGAVRQNDISGGLAGESKNSVITHSHSTGNIRGEVAGGLVGSMTDGSITNSYATGSVDASALTSGGAGGNIGGLVGEANQTTTNTYSISRSYATGNVGTKYTPLFIGEMGGLIGMAYSRFTSESTCPADFPKCLPRIENNFATGQVHTLHGDAGGLIGAAGYGYSSYTVLHIQNNYSTGKVTTDAPDQSRGVCIKAFCAIGGFIGQAPSALKNYVVNSYWDIETSGLTYSANGIGKKTYQMYQQSTYINWDFNTIWRIDEDQDYPRLIDNDLPGILKPN